MKATLYKHDGTSMSVRPANGKSFSLAELQGFVGGYIESIDLNDGSVMVVNEDGKLCGLPLNTQATDILRSSYKGATDFIVGDALICKPNNL